ncbi:CDP-alcohol phosphatidyltransferase family protein [Actinophytocola sp.]|uniref:CDP-alcohol phosphatidyltransferase family protein n=1 Tax=Actinophytocola sp. TaxID=1872138 RepID=UPI0025BF2443|nr:CDP-alcohol phosphatidyltransferase family protein [Actinophytocola sp.]
MLPLRAVAVGMGEQVALLAVLGAFGLGRWSWLPALLYAAVVCGALAAGLHRAGAPALGPANHVTLARSALVGAVIALVTDTMRAPATVPVLVTVASVALAMDAVDGRVARGTATATRLGARFDMEIDALLILVLSLHVATLMGAWVLAIGAWRYAFVLAGVVLPWLRRPLPPSTASKTVAAAQGVVLVVAAAGLLPRVLTTILVAAALAALTWSFVRDIRRLHQDQAAGPKRRR